MNITILNANVRKTMSFMWFTHFLACRTRSANGFSHVYILITWMPEIISSINLTLSSVLGAIFNRNSDVFFPNQPENKTISFGTLMRRISGGRHSERIQTFPNHSDRFNDYTRKRVSKIDLKCLLSPLKIEINTQTDIEIINTNNW